ncbi:MAG: aspartate/glutamate racemase family protein [Williamsia sp.]|nr:aspartate/glutamate racemase family protein [Williamsia sp.]
MKKIGLVGGTSWASTIDYYKFINQETNKRLGNLNFAECIIYSVNFERFRKYNAAHDWNATFELLADAAHRLKDAGADVIMLGANTAHIVAERVSNSVGLPLIDIRVATVNAIKKQGLKRVALLGTVYTMELDFYKSKLAQEGLEVSIPQTKDEIKFIEKSLAQELSKGIVLPETKLEYLAIINRLIEQGAEGVILGCTEIPLIISQNDVPVPVFNTTLIHVQAAVEYALSDRESTFE